MAEDERQDSMCDNLASARAGIVRESREVTAIAPDELRMWLFVRTDLPMPAGKLAAQAGHAFATCLLNAAGENEAVVNEYLSQAQGKIVVSVKSEESLVNAVDACRASSLNAVLVEDAGHTVFGQKTLTVGAVGPCRKSDLPKKVQRLRLFEGYYS